MIIVQVLKKKKNTELYTLNFLGMNFAFCKFYLKKKKSNTSNLQVL